MCFLLLTSLALPANAGASGAFLRAEYDITQEDACFYGRELPPGGDLIVTVDGKKAVNSTFTTLEKEEIPVTVYCLVEASSSMIQSAMKQQKDVLLTISNRMRPEDNMVLGFLGETLAEGKALDDRDARNTAIETMKRTVWYTNLLQGTSEALDSLSTNTTYHTNRCLLILSDGHDSGRTSVTSAQVLEKIQGATIPVYSIVLGTKIEAKDLNLQKRFADASLGGFCCRSESANASAATAAETVWNSILNASMIRIDRADLGDGETDREILVRYDAGNTRYEDTVIVRTMDIPQVEETAETIEATTEATEPEVSSEEDTNMFWVYALVGAGIVILAAATALIIFAKRRKSAKAIQEQPGEILSEEHADDPIVSEEPQAPESVSQVTAPVPGGCTVSLVAIMHPEVKADFRLIPKMETTFGRDNRADLVLNGNDRKLSGIHASLLWDGKMLLIRDKGSTNGTMVNEESCFGETWIPVENGAKIRAGGYEYRISYQPESE